MNRVYPPRPAYLSTADVAGLLGVSQRTIVNLISRGELSATRIGRQWRVTPEELDRYLAAPETPPSPPVMNGTPKVEPSVRPKSSPTATPAAEPSGRWITVTEAATVLLADISGLTITRAKARVSKAASESRFRTNGRRGRGRRIDRDSFSTWRIEQREKDLASYE